LVSENLDDYFHAVIIQSGVISFFHETEWSESVLLGEHLKNRTNCTNVECLHALDAHILYSHGHDLNYMPTIDGKFLKRPIIDSLRDGQVKKVPVVIGSTRSEFSDVFCNNSYPANMTMGNVTNILREMYGYRTGNLVLQYYDFTWYQTTRDALVDIFADFCVHCPTKKAAMYLATATDTYFYTFERSLEAYVPSCRGADHFVDVLFLFPSLLEKRGLSFTDEEIWVSHYMNELWTTFAHSPRDPVLSIPNVPSWKKYDSMETELAIDYGNYSEIRTRHYERICEMWDNPYKQMLLTFGVVFTSFAVVAFMVITVCVIPYIIGKWKNRKQQAAYVQFY
jgi:carboxylesterase type B